VMPNPFYGYAPNPQYTMVPQQAYGPKPQPPQPPTGPVEPIIPPTFVTRDCIRVSEQTMLKVRAALHDAGFFGSATFHACPGESARLCGKNGALFVLLGLAVMDAQGKWKIPSGGCPQGYQSLVPWPIYGWRFEQDEFAVWRMCQPLGFGFGG